MRPRRSKTEFHGVQMTGIGGYLVKVDTRSKNKAMAEVTLLRIQHGG